VQQFPSKIFIRLSVSFVFGCISKESYNYNTEAWHVMPRSVCQDATWEVEDFGKSGEEAD
jgi:hypothetical protein